MNTIYFKKTDVRLMSWGVVFLCLIGLVSSQVVVEKTASHGVVREGDTINITFTVVNDGGASLTGVFQDPLFLPGSVDGARVVGEWLPLKAELSVSVPAKTRREYSYSIKIEDIPAPWKDKNLSIGMAVLKSNNGSWLGKSNEVYVVFDVESDVPCNFNGRCEPDLGENYNTCYADCRSGGKDGYCDGKEDFVCDTDCGVDRDPDCTPAQKTETTATQTKESGISIGVLVVVIAVLAVAAFVVLKRGK